MTKDEWSTCTDPDQMLQFLRASCRVSERKLRLFGVASCRHIWSQFTDDRCRRAVEVVERYADGLATSHEMDLVWKEVNVARDLAFGPESTAPRRHRSRLGRTTSWAAYALVNIPPDNADSLDVVWKDIMEAAEFARDIRGKVRVLKQSQADLLRDVFGPLPFRLVPIDPSLLTWRDGTIVRLAQAIYDERAFDRMPVLADALEDAGCHDAEILGHCREMAPHVRGCWVVDLLLGKE